MKLDNYLATLAVVRAVVVCYFRRNSSSPSTSSPQRICTIRTLNKFNCCSSKSHHNLSIAMATQHTAVEVCNPPFLPQHHRNKLSRRPPTYHSPRRSHLDSISGPKRLYYYNYTWINKQDRYFILFLRLFVHINICRYFNHHNQSLGRSWLCFSASSMYSVMYQVRKQEASLLIGRHHW